MIDLYNSRITDILPDNIKTDPTVRAVSYAISNMVKRIITHSQKAGIYAAVDELDEEIVDLLAVELRTKYYGDWLTLKEKREIVKKTLLWYCKAGTLFTVQELTDFVFQSAKAQEWFDYAGTPYLFRILVDVISQDMPLEIYLEYLKSLYGVKNTRSHLEAVIFQYHKEAKVKSVAAGGMGSVIKVKARLTEKIEALSGDNAAAALFLNQNITIKCDDKIKENEIYTLNEDGEKVRVLTENGSVVTIG